MAVSNRVKWTDFGRLKRSTTDAWKERLRTDSSFPEELAIAFSDWLKEWGNPVKSYWDDEQVFSNSADLFMIGFWAKMPVETFLERFKSEIAPEVAESVRIGANR